MTRARHTNHPCAGPADNAPWWRVGNVTITRAPGPAERRTGQPQPGLMTAVGTHSTEPSTAAASTR